MMTSPSCVRTLSTRTPAGGGVQFRIERPTTGRLRRHSSLRLKPLMECEVHHSLEPLATEWDELGDRVGATPFQRPGWLMAWWRAFGVGRLHVLALRKGGRLVGLMPLARVRGVLRSLTNAHTPEYAPLAEKAHTLDLLRALFGQCQRRITLAYLASPPPIVEYRSVAADHRYRVANRPLERSPYIDLCVDYQEFERGLNPKLLSDLRRRRRRLSEQGDILVEVLEGGDRLDQLLAEGFAVEASGWKGSAGTGTAIMCREDTLRFYTGVARWASERGILRMAFLRLDGIPLAFEYALEHQGNYYRLKAGFDQTFHRFSPGKLLLAATVKRAFDQGLTRFSFLGHDEPYKLEWTERCTEYALLHAFAPTGPGRLEWSAYKVMRPMAVRLGLRR
jgi:CelD/BcsL family acetyltransferase involved in cellulose biosynthesis